MFLYVSKETQNNLNYTKQYMQELKTSIENCLISDNSDQSNVLKEFRAKRSGNGHFTFPIECVSLK